VRKKEGLGGARVPAAAAGGTCRRRRAAAMILAWPAHRAVGMLASE
jgi:hypothetical protein